MLPNFTSQGLLPPGIHPLEDWMEFELRFATSVARRRVVEGLCEGLRTLQNVGCRRVIVEGDLITAVARPEGFQAIWETTAVDLDRLAPVLCDTRAGGAAQRALYRGTFHPTGTVGSVSARPFLSLFQTDGATGVPKGIVTVPLAQVRL